MKYPKLFMLSVVLSLVVVSSAFAADEAVPQIKDRLQNGSRGAQVSIMQKIFNDFGFLSSKIDSVFGKGTEGAVKKFQSSTGITPTGTVGPETASALNGVFEQSSDCLVVTVPQKGRVVSAPFIVSGFIKANCAWNVSAGGSAGFVQLVDAKGAIINTPAQVQVHTITNPPHYPLFFTAQINVPAMPYSGQALLYFSDNAPVPDSKLYSVTLK